MSIEALAFSLDFVGHKKGCKLSQQFFYFWNLALSVIELFEGKPGDGRHSGLIGENIKHGTRYIVSYLQNKKGRNL
jgi:hypothetical protein